MMRNRTYRFLKIFHAVCSRMSDICSDDSFHDERERETIGESSRGKKYSTELLASRLEIVEQREEGKKRAIGRCILCLDTCQPAGLAMAKQRVVGRAEWLGRVKEGLCQVTNINARSSCSTTLASKTPQANTPTGETYSNGFSIIVTRSTLAHWPGKRADRFSYIHISRSR